MRAWLHSCCLPPTLHNSGEPTQRVCCRYRDLVMEEEDGKLDSMLTSLQKKDELTQKAEATTKLKVQAFQCHTCKSLTERRETECRGHDVQRVTTIKRWWLCSSCGHHFSTVGVRLPKSHCPRYLQVQVCFCQLRRQPASQHALLSMDPQFDW